MLTPIQKRHAQNMVTESITEKSFIESLAAFELAPYGIDKISSFLDSGWISASTAAKAIALRAKSERMQRHARIQREHEEKREELKNRPTHLFIKETGSQPVRIDILPNGLLSMPV